MTNKDVCVNFVNGKNINKHSLNMWIGYNGSVLFSYSTAIAQFAGERTIIVNTTKYSNTTSHHQGNLRRAIQQGWKVLETTKSVPLYTSDLKRYL